jgi:hypothetical protein
MIVCREPIAIAVGKRNTQGSLTKQLRLNLSQTTSLY